MNWILLAALSALFEGINTILLKKSLAKIDEYLISFGISFFSFFPIAYLAYNNGIPEIGDNFLSNLLIVCLLDFIGIICTFRALKFSDVSLAMPLATFTPFFLLFTSPIMVGETISFMGYIGVGLIIFGSYFLNIQQSKKGFFAPFKALLSNRSSQLMLFTAALFSVTCNMHKIGILESSPLFYGATHQLVLGLYLLPFIFLRIKKI